MFKAQQQGQWGWSRVSKGGMGELKSLREEGPRSWKVLLASVRVLAFMLSEMGATGGMI